MARILEPMLELLDQAKKTGGKENLNEKAPLLAHIELIDDCSDNTYTIKK